MSRVDSGRFDLVVAALAGVASVVLVLGTLAVEQLQVTHEVQLWAPRRVQLPDSAPVRAIVLTDLVGDAPRLVTPEVQVLVIGDGDRRERDVSPLEAGAFDGLAGLAFVGESPGRATLLVRARGPSGELLASARQPLDIVERAGEPLPVRARVTDALQILALARPPEVLAAIPELDVRVEGGVCVPEQPCRLWVRRGPSALMPRLAECTSIDVGATQAGTELVSIDVVVHGPEARCRLHLDPSEIATDLQLPVGLATPWLTFEQEPDLLRVRAEPPPGRDAVLLDVYVGHRWIEASSVARGTSVEVPLRTATSRRGGIVRLQARADLGSSERAYQRAVYVDVPPEREGDPDSPSEAAALAELLGETTTSLQTLEARRWATLRLEDELIDVPAPVSGFADDEAGLAELRASMRLFCGVGVLLAVLAILGAVLRRGLASARQAREVLVEAGAAQADDRSARWRSWLTVAAFVAAIGLAILLGAAFLVARPYFMG